MKILSSSPYAAFSPKEWNKATRSCSNSNLPVKIQKVYCSSSKILVSKKVIAKNVKNFNFIQLSFA